MRTVITLIIVFVALGATIAPTPTYGGPLDEATVIVTLRSGESFEGRIVKRSRDTLLFETALGARKIDKGAVVAQRPADDAREAFSKELNGVDEKDVAGNLELARRCRSKGLTSGYSEALERVFERDPANEEAWKMIEREAPVYRLAGKNGKTMGKSSWARAEVDLLYRGLKKAGFTEAALIRSQLASLPMDVQVNQAIKNAERGRGPQRWVAASLLGRTSEVRRVKTLYKVALGDEIWQVRRMAVRSLKERDNGSTFRPFVKALLLHPTDAVRMHAAEALGHLGDKRGVAPLVRSMKANGNSTAARSNFSQISQLAYVKDYDVEVAQTAFIADPVVDIVMDGIVLDAAVMSVTARRQIIGNALNRLTGTRLSSRRGSWEDWWRENKKNY